MSRKPPKLAPIEGKELSSVSGKTPEFALPPLKQCGDVGANNAALTPTPRRSSLTRHFLNCNGSTPGTRRRFQPKASPIETKAAASSSPVRSIVATSNDNGSDTNGIVEGKAPVAQKVPAAGNSSATKVNGTMANGVGCAKASEPPKLIRRPKSLGSNSESSANSNSDSQGSSVTVNGRKTESVETRHSASNSVGSQNNSSISAVKRTSRFSQSSVAVQSPKLTTCGAVPASAAREDKTMPALVACSPTIISTEENSRESLDLNSDENSVKTDESISEEPKIIRKGDTVIKSYVDEKTGRITVFEKGMKLEVCDFGSGKWYPAKVMNIEWNKQEILVHYSNWSSRYDEWISMKSSRVRPGKNTNVVRLQFAIGERVEAVWPMDSHRYTGTVTQQLPQDCYEVTFDDGIKLKRSAHQLFKVTADEEPPKLVTSEVETPSKESQETKEDPPTPIVKKRRKKSFPTPPVASPKLPVSPAKMTENVAEDGTAGAASDTPGGPRPSHFSVFDPPQGDLGKRRRTVNDYAALVNVRRRGPNMKGPRRPKSEGSGLTSNTSMSANDISTDDTELTSTESVINESVEPEIIETKRRQKSGSTTHVPINQQPSSDIPKELPPAEPIALEPLLPSPPVNETPKKRKQIANVPSANTNVEIKVPPKPEITQNESVQLVPSASTSTSATTTTVARRTKSLSTIQLGVFPPLTDSDTPNDTKVDSGFVDEFGTAIIIEQNNVDGFWKCPLNECRKNFRKDSLLKMHFKHYHPELKVANARGIANVVQMAQARTAFDNDPGDYYTWPKFTCPEPTVTPEASTITPEASKTNHEVSTSSETPDTLHKKTTKGIHLHKTPTPTPKVSPVAGAAAAVITSPAGSVKNSEVSPKDASKTPIRSPRLRLSRKRNFVLTKYGRIRASKKLKPSTPISNEAQKDENSSDSMTTEIYKKTKTSQTSESCEDASNEPRDDSINIASPKSSLPTTSTTSSPSVSDQFSVESFSGSSSGDPVFQPSCTETESQPTLGSRIPKSRWSKSHIRRGLMSSNVRRVGSGKLQNSTTLFLRKRMQLRKFMGKRGSRQKRTSILSRISSGRMRVILEALNQRSLRRQRFRAHRRYRDVKVDVINCVCSSKTEFGLMIQCELCLCWQHGSCFNVQSNSQLPDFYACQSCSEPEKVRLSRKYEWAESEFYRLGKLPSFPFAPRFSKEDSRIMKMCTNLSSNLIEAYSMIKGLKLKERICFGQPEHPQLYEWNSERPPPQEEIQKDRFNKYFKPVLRRLLLENKSDSLYHTKLRTLAEARMKLRKYSDAVESARSTLKKKLGCRAAAFLDHICDSVMNDMVRAKRRAVAEDNIKMENLDLRKRATAEQAYHRLLKVREEVLKHPDGPPVGVYDDKFPSSFYNGGSSNGLRDSSLHVKDFCLLKKYMKERRNVETIISLMLTRMSKEFPEDWKNLMKISRGFIDESSKDSYQDAKMKWISSVIVTFNTLRILLMQIYSENNAQKQTKLCLDFERTTIKLFDLFGIGLAEERVGTKKQHASNSRCKRIRGLETVDMLGQPNSPIFVKSKDVNPKLTADLDDARKEILKRLGSSSKPLSNKDVEDLLTAASETKRFEEETIHSSTDTTSVSSSQSTKESKQHSSSNSSSQSGRLHTHSTDVFSRARKPDGQIAFNFSNDVQLLEAVKVAGDIPQDECTEENLNLEFAKPSSESLPSSQTGILAVPADSRITPEKCKKNLVRDILLQQQQIDVYLDKIEAQIIKLTSQSRSGGVTINMKPAELSAQRTRMLQSLELVTRLSKTVIGENDVVESTQSEDMDVSETTLSDYSDMDISSESDGFDNASNFSGTDTETADEGDDITGFDDDLLDV